ncbi:putative signal recognition particle, SRP54 subunit, GTPase domain-containing protein [Helianthus annuus]|nr:putative signal recognition particle, SRP54 subunit, GTPase domain-containing protein [Helianthus annuus]
MNTYKYINKLCLVYKKRHTYVPIVWVRFTLFKKPDIARIFYFISVWLIFCDLFWFLCGVQGPIDGYLISNRTYRVAATKRPLLFIGTGEHMDEFELIEIMCSDLIWDFVCWVDI